MNVNKHGVDVSKIQVGDVVEVWAMVTVEAIGADCCFGHVLGYDNTTNRIKHDEIEFHYARQPREERG